MGGGRHVISIAPVPHLENVFDADINGPGCLKIFFQLFQSSQIVARVLLVHQGIDVTINLDYFHVEVGPVERIPIPVTNLLPALNLRHI